MKQFIFILFLPPAIGLSAQTGDPGHQTDTLLPSLFLKNGKVNLVDTASPGSRTKLLTQPAEPWLNQGRFSHNTSRGRIYKMPVDNMPCLVPDSGKLAQMPVMRPKPDSRMPNAFRRRPPSNR